MLRSGKHIRTLLLAATVGCQSLGALASPVHAVQLGEGPGGPILIITTPADAFGRYYAEILRNEGLNAFAVEDIGAVSAGMLAQHDVVILAEMPLTAIEATMFSDWVAAGGNLIAMRPDPQLSSLLGITPQAGAVTDGYLLIDTATSSGAGLAAETIQYHGTADLYALNGATAVATLYLDEATATTSPAVTLRAVGGSGGHAAAFAYDLARSVVYTRQGNPAWVGQERDGFLPIRPNDLFFGDASADPQPDWVDLDKVAIPQADEQQRLLANLILEINLDRNPLPRFWYFPRGEKAVVIMTGDEHDCCDGSVGRFDIYMNASPPGCSVADWECVRSTSYVYPGVGLSDADAQVWDSLGFELGVHVNTLCSDWSQSTLADFFTNQLGTFAAQFPSLPAPSSERTHCIAWSDWATHAQVMLAHGIRLDTNYYYAPATWIQDRPGMFTGSGMPMRFADVDGTMIDVYQAATQMADDSGQSYPFTVDSLLDNAIGTRGYYGAFAANMHTDSPHSAASNAIVTSAQARGVPIVSSRQMLDWLDGRNGSRFDDLSWSVNKLSFVVTPGLGAIGLQVLLPTGSHNGVLETITLDGDPVSFAVETIKGVEYGAFAGIAGSYTATYRVFGDADGDGFAPPADCNDSDVTVFPGASELCNGIDDDCNGQADDGFLGLGASCSVGLGECTAGGEIMCTSDGLETVCDAVAGTPLPELCDGLDNDCDGQSDEDFADLGVVCGVGIGQCAATGSLGCAGDGLGTVCSAVPGTPEPELCDGVDNDCDGEVDESTSGAICDTGQLGPCASGVEQCLGGDLICIPDVTPVPETCNASDDDCDGVVDELNPDGGGQCGVSDVGECIFGILVCQAGDLVCLGKIDPVVEVCDSLDNDCDGIIDNGDVGQGLSCTTGVPGVCGAGTTACQSGSIVCLQDQQVSAETCDGVDNDCDGQVDEATSGAACDTGQLGPCADGVQQCIAGALMCVPNTAPTPETCNGVDDDCNGVQDDGNPDGGAACGVTDVGVCRLGSLVCESASLICSGNVDPEAETCDGLDNDCDGSVDNDGPGAGQPCDTGTPGVCSGGSTDCQGGVIVCVQDLLASTEVCDALDNDCDGDVDEDTAGNACDTQLPGRCAAGTERCQEGEIVCIQDLPPVTETCNALDDDCDGLVDEDNASGGDTCTTGLPGICSPGETACLGGTIVCAGLTGAQPERCNGADDDCDGEVDNGDPQAGGACTTDQPGNCSFGIERCQEGGLVCIANVEPAEEICRNGEDEDCDGATDEHHDCVLCLTEKVVGLTTQTKSNKIKLSTVPNKDKIIIKGAFLQQPSSKPFAPEDVTVRLTDENGRFFEGQLFADDFSSAPTGRKYVYTDSRRPFENDGIKQAKISLKRNGVTTKYAIKAQDLDLSTFIGTDSTLSVRLGDTCYFDAADTCLLNASGTTLKCR